MDTKRTINDASQDDILRLVGYRRNALEMTLVKCSTETLGILEAPLKNICDLIRKYFEVTINNLGSVITSLSVLQSTMLHPYASLFGVLTELRPDQSLSLRKDYVQMTQEYYYKNYKESLSTFGFAKVVPEEATIVIGATGPNSCDRVGNFLGSFSSLSISSLDAIQSTSMSPKGPKAKMAMNETIIGIIAMLYGNICREEIFVCDFFSASFTPPNECRSMLREIFEQCRRSFEKRLEEKLTLTANITQLLSLYESITEEAKVGNSSLMCSAKYSDDFIKGLARAVTGRINSLLELQTNSIKGIVNTMAGNGDTPIVSGGIAPITRRFVNFLLLLPLQTWETLPTEGIDKLQISFDVYLQKVASRDMIFLINNYAYIQRHLKLTPVYASGRYRGELIDRLHTYYEEKITYYIDLYVQHTIKVEFGTEMDTDGVDKLETINGQLIKSITDYQIVCRIKDQLSHALTHGYGDREPSGMPASTSEKNSMMGFAGE